MGLIHLIQFDFQGGTILLIASPLYLVESVADLPCLACGNGGSHNSGKVVGREKPISGLCSRIIVGLVLCLAGDVLPRE